MSYLLDALKKAEQERKQGEQSELPLYTEPEVKAVLPMWLVALIVMVLMATFVKLFVGGNETEAVSDVHDSLSQGDVIQEDEPLKVEVAPVESQKVDQGEKRNKQVVAKELSELDSVTLSKIPSLSLESHIYSPASQYRSVIINGQSYDEGALLASGVVLSEITQTGIIIKVGEQSVVLPKGISWVSTKHAN